MIIPAEIIEKYLTQNFQFLRVRTSSQVYMEVSTNYNSLEIETAESKKNVDASISDIGRFGNRALMVLFATCVAVSVPCFGAVNAHSRYCYY